MATQEAGGWKAWGIYQPLVTVANRGGRPEPERPVPRRYQERSFIARYTTTVLATPVATAMAACITGPQAAPPPWGTWEKNLTCSQPSSRAISYSGTLSTE